MAAPSHRSNKTGKLMRELGNIRLTDWCVPWAFFVLALAVTRVLTGESTIRTEELSWGFAPSFLIGWLAVRENGQAMLIVGTLLVMGGIVIGLSA